MLLAQTTDTPVWWVFVATCALALVTALLAIAAWFALEQLDEAKTDRRIQVLTNLAARWNSDTLVRALQTACVYDAEELAAVVETARADPTWNPFRERKRKQSQREFVILLRVPDFFEDLAIMANTVKLDDDGLAIFKGLVQDEWAAWKLAVYTMRGPGGDKFSYTKFEELANRMDTVPDL